MKNLISKKSCLSACIPLWLVFLSLGMSAARGAVILSHSGSNDPQNEGWSLVNGGSTGLSFGPSSVGAGATPVWRIADSSAGSDGNIHNLYYLANLPAGENYFLEGWSLKASVKLDGSFSNTGSGTEFSFLTKYALDGTVLGGNSRRSYQVLLGSESGKTTLGLTGYSGGTLFTALNTGVIDVELRFNAGDSGVSLVVNGQQIISDYLGASTTTSAADQVHWGKFSTAVSNGRVSNWAAVEFAAIPEPGSITLMALALGAFCIFYKRGFRSFWPRVQGVIYR